MSTRELKSLTREGTSTTSSRLRSGGSSQLPQDTVITMEKETVGSQDLQQQLAEAAEELRSVQADYEQQLQQVREMAENAKEYGEDQCRKVQELEQELEEETKRRKGIEKKLSETIDGWSAAGDKWDADMETMRMKLELDGLKQLEEVRKQFDKERERHREERDRDATLIVELKEKLSTLESSIPPSAPGATSEVHGVKESGSKKGDGDSDRGSGSPEPTGSSEKHVTFADGKSERGQTESPSDSAHSVVTGGEKGCEGAGDSETTSPASTSSDPTGGGPSSAEVISLNGSTGGEHASEVSSVKGIVPRYKGYF